MSLSLPPDKVQKIRKECRLCLHMPRTTPRQLAHLIGLMISTSPTVLPAPLHYRMLQMLCSQTLLNHQSCNIFIPCTGSPSRLGRSNVKLQQLTDYSQASRSSYTWSPMPQRKVGGNTAEPHKRGQEDFGASKTTHQACTSAEVNYNGSILPGQTDKL